MRKWYEDFAAAAGDDDGLTQQEIEELKASYARIIENAGRQADDLERITGVSLGTGADTQTATARGFQAMSQETGSELNGRFTAIQETSTILKRSSSSKPTTEHSCSTRPSISGTS